VQAGPHGGIDFCGRKLMFRGTGGGSGGNPISSSWQQGMATNVCPGDFIIEACVGYRLKRQRQKSIPMPL
jgi:hypothetical protein